MHILSAINSIKKPFKMYAEHVKSRRKNLNHKYILSTLVRYFLIGEKVISD